MTTGRPKAFDYDQALQAATKQFWAVGYSATSLQDLLHVMGLSKSSFYQSFGTKHDLFLKCLEHYQSRLTEGLKQQLNEGSSGTLFIRNLLFHVISEASQPIKNGCLLVNTAGEFAQRDKDIADLVTRGNGKLRQVLLNAIRQAQQQREIGSQKDAELLANYLLTTIFGLRSMVKSGADEAALKEIVDVAMGVLN